MPAFGLARSASRSGFGRSGVTAKIAVAMGLMGCAESALEPLVMGPGDPIPEGDWPAAVLVSETDGFLPDEAELPDWNTAARRLTSPGCVFHFRRVTGVYAPKLYEFEYSEAAREEARNVWRPLVYIVTFIVKRPTADGGMETLPERLGIRAVCLMPNSDRGMAEAVRRVEAILVARGNLPSGDVSARRGR